MPLAGDQDPAPLTPRQADVFATVRRYYDFLGEGCPSVYVARVLSIRHQTVLEHFSALGRKGWLKAENSPAIPKTPFLARR